MKKVLSLTYAFLLVGAAGITLSQTDNSTPAASTAPAAKFAPMKARVKENHPFLDKIRTRIESQNERIMIEVKDKKLTMDQAKADHAKFKSLREEIQSDLKANGKKELTVDQFNKMNKELDETSKAMKEEMGAAASATPGTK